jgi:DNA-binding protein H-NS
MAQRSLHLGSMSIDDLLKLRGSVEKCLTEKVTELKRQVALLNGGFHETPTRGRGRRKSLKGRKVPPKYRSPKGETWAGRGARPLWLTAQIKQGKKLDDFLIAKNEAKTGRRKKVA